MSTDRTPTWRGRPRRRFAGLAAALAVALTGAACGDGGGPVDEVTESRADPNPGVVPTIAGGVELGSLEPATVLVGTDLAFGTPLPSEQAAAEAYLADPEIGAVLSRQVFGTRDGRHLASVVVLALDGSQLFDDAVLEAFVRGAVSAAGGAPAEEVALAGQTVLRSSDPAGGLVAVASREANLLTLVTGARAADVELVVTRQLEARARGEVGSATAVTPLVALPVDAAFVPVPTVTFAPIPPPEEEDGPEVPNLPGATAVQGRYGVVAGERRTVVWAFTVDPGAYPSAEALAPALGALVAGRAGGAEPTPVEVGDRVVLVAVNDPGEPSAHGFRHGGLVLLVEGIHPDQLDAVTTAWIAALQP